MHINKFVVGDMGISLYIYTIEAEEAVVSSMIDPIDKSDDREWSHRLSMNECDRKRSVVTVVLYVW